MPTAIGYLLPAKSLSCVSDPDSEQDACRILREPSSPGRMDAISSTQSPAHAARAARSFRSKASADFPGPDMPKRSLTQVVGKSDNEALDMSDHAASAKASSQRVNMKDSAGDKTQGDFATCLIKPLCETTPSRMESLKIRFSAIQDQVWSIVENLHNLEELACKSNSTEIESMKKNRSEATQSVIAPGPRRPSADLRLLTHPEEEFMLGPNGHGERNSMWEASANVNTQIEQMRQRQTQPEQHHSFPRVEELRPGAKPLAMQEPLSNDADAFVQELCMKLGVQLGEVFKHSIDEQKMATELFSVEVKRLNEAVSTIKSMLCQSLPTPPEFRDPRGGPYAEPEKAELLESANDRSDLTRSESAASEVDGVQLSRTFCQGRNHTSMADLFFHDNEVDKPIYKVDNLYHTTGWAQRIARHAWFWHLSEFVVCLNAIWIGFETDRNPNPIVFDAHFVFLLGDTVFLTYFTVEWVIRFCAFAKKRDAFSDGWFTFDALLVASMLLDSAVQVFAFLSQKNPITIPTSPLRMLRMLKLTRMGKLMHMFPELEILLKGFSRSLTATFSTLVFIVLITYIWSLVIHMLLSDEDELNRELSKYLMIDFRTVPRCMWTLTLCGTLMLDGAGYVMTRLIWGADTNIFVAGILFFIFACLSALMVLQLLIGVLCDVVATVKNEQRDHDAIFLIKQQLLAALQECDNGNGSLTRDELLDLIRHRKHRATLTHLGVNHTFFLQLIDMMFPDRNSKIGVANALKLILLARSDNATTVETMAAGFCYLAKQIYSLDDRMKILVPNVSGKLFLG